MAKRDWDEEIRIGDKVETAVFVDGKRIPMHHGIVTAVHSGYCDVDIMSLHGGAPWITQHVISHLRKVKEAERNGQA